jgi:hypothetical protein
MAQQRASGLGHVVKPEEGLLLELASDARSVVVEAKARFDVAMAKSDALDDADVSKVAGNVRVRAKVEGRASTARVLGLRMLHPIYLRYLWQGSGPST